MIWKYLWSTKWQLLPVEGEQHPANWCIGSPLNISSTAVTSCGSTVGHGVQHCLPHHNHETQTKDHTQQPKNTIMVLSFHSKLLENHLIKRPQTSLNYRQVQRILQNENATRILTKRPAIHYYLIGFSICT